MITLAEWLGDVQGEVKYGVITRIIKKVIESYGRAFIKPD